MNGIFAVSYLRWTLLLFAVGLLALGLPGVAESKEGLPSRLTVSVVEGDERLRVTWDEPDETGDLLGYDVRWRPVGVVNLWEQSGPAPVVALEYRISNVDNGTEYELQVRARNIIGEGPWSAVVTAVPGPNPSWPYAPPPQSAQKPSRDPHFLDLDGTHKPRSTPTPAPTPEPPAQEPPGKKDFKVCVGGKDCNNADSPYYWKDNSNSWKKP